MEHARSWRMILCAWSTVRMFWWNRPSICALWWLVCTHVRRSLRCVSVSPHAARNGEVRSSPEAVSLAVATNDPK